MRLCEDVQFVRWKPDFSSSGLVSPRWTKLVFDGFELCNGAESVDWLENPVQVILCEACGLSDCEVGGYVQISRLGEHILWTVPHTDPDDDFESHQYQCLPALVRLGTLLISTETWSRWCRKVRKLPVPDELPATRRTDLAAAWMREAPWSIRPLAPLDAYARLERFLLASDHGERDEALQRIESLVAWINEDPEASVPGRIVPAERVIGERETWFFDTQPLDEWTAIVHTDSGLTLSFGDSWALLPSPLVG
jgi:hypothetical protein